MRSKSLSDSRLVGGAIAVYLVIVIAAFIKFNVSLTPDRIVMLLLIAALGTGRVRQFFRDWSIFLIVLLAWQFLSGMSRHVGNFKPHVTEMITFDRWLFFGQLPTTWLQHHFYHPGRVSWYDMLATILYLLHFVFPMVVAFLLWWLARPVFLEFMVAFLVLALAGFATYVLYPAAPPWIAANWYHHFAHVYQIKDRDVKVIGGRMNISMMFNWFWSVGWDRFGAMPSEHAAFPFLCFLYARRAWKRWSYAILAYCAVVWVAVVYLGEHYVADVVVGILYAVLSYVFVRLAVTQRTRAAMSDRNTSGKEPSVSDSLTA